jgi:hypothetical protein
MPIETKDPLRYCSVPRGDEHVVGMPIEAEDRRLVLADRLSDPPVVLRLEVAHADLR